MSVENSLGINTANQKNIDLVERLAKVAVSSLGLEIWGIDIIGSATKPTVRIFVDKPFDGKPIPFVKPQTKEEKSRKKTIHPKQLEKLANSPENLSPETAFNANQVNFEDEINSENVSIEQCSKISRLLGLAMEVEDVFDDAWILEVSSPGLERTFYKLEQMKAYVGHPIDLVLNITHPDFENRKKFKGTLLEVGVNDFKLEFEDKTYIIEWETVKRVRLIHVFPEAV